MAIGFNPVTMTESGCRIRRSLQGEDLVCYDQPLPSEIRVHTLPNGDRLVLGGIYLEWIVQDEEGYDWRAAARNYLEGFVSCSGGLVGRYWQRNQGICFAVVSASAAGIVVDLMDQFRQSAGADDRYYQVNRFNNRSSVRNQIERLVVQPDILVDPHKRVWGVYDEPRRRKKQPARTHVVLLHRPPVCA